MTQQASINIRANDTTQQTFEQFNRRVRNQSQAIDRLRGTTERYNRTHMSFRGNMRSSRGAMQQMGFQIQDVAVQLQGGTNALQVFSQQGSQMAGAFGPGGAIFGAVIAVGGAIAGVLAPRLIRGRDIMKEFGEVTERLEGTFADMNSETYLLSEAMAELGNRSETALRIELAQSLAAAERGIEQLRDRIAEVTEEDIGLDVDGLMHDLQVMADFYDREVAGIPIRMNEQDIEFLGREVAELFNEAAEEAAEELNITEAAANELVRALYGYSRGNISPEELQRVADSLGMQSDEARELAVELRTLTEEARSTEDRLNALDQMLRSGDFQFEMGGDGGDDTEAAERSTIAWRGYYNMRLESEALLAEREQELMNQRDALVQYYNARETAHILAVRDREQEVLEQRLEAYRQYYTARQESSRMADEKEAQILEDRKAAYQNLFTTAADTFASFANDRYQMELAALRNTKGLTEEEIKARERSAREAFKTQKNWARGAVVANTGVAIMNALATEDPFTKWATVAAVTLTGLRQLNNINAQTFGGGGSIAGADQGAQPIQNQNQQTVNQQVSINFTGAASREDIAAALSDVFADDGVLFDQDSAQAQVILNG